MLRRTIRACSMPCSSPWRSTTGRATTCTPARWCGSSAPSGSLCLESSTPLKWRLAGQLAQRQQVIPRAALFMTLRRWLSTPLATL